MRKEGGKKLQEYIQIAGQRSWEDNVVCVARDTDSQQGSTSDAPEEAGAGDNSQVKTEDGQAATEDYGQDLIDTNDIEIDAVRIKLTGLPTLPQRTICFSTLVPTGKSLRRWCAWTS